MIETSYYYTFASHAVSVTMTQHQKVQQAEFNTLQLFAVGLTSTALQT